jgi:hypothetical protein
MLVMLKNKNNKKKQQQQQIKTLKIQRIKNKENAKVKINLYGG